MICECGRQAQLTFTIDGKWKCAECLNIGEAMPYKRIHSNPHNVPSMATALSIAEQQRQDAATQEQAMQDISDARVACAKTWKNVFNSDNKRALWGHIIEAQAAAYQAGYRYFTWNGYVYTTEAGENTDTLVEDVE